MSIFGRAAVHAANRCRADRALPPDIAWRKAVNACTDKPSMAEKCCPWGAFLGLVETGQVVGIPAVRCEASTVNGEYALEAVRLLRKGVRPPTIIGLWRMIPDAPKKPNDQLSVVLALWDAGLLTQVNGS